MRNSRPLVSKKSQPVRTFSRLKLYAAVLAASQWMVSGPVWAAPEGGEVVGGEGIIQQAGVETIINQATERMAIDWRSFDVAANERVEFIQPSSSSVALNRVLSNRGSEILGRIDANGQVMLVNANGVVFGKDSVVNVGGMIASGLNIDPTSFINGDFALNSIEGAEGKVINYGIINAATGGSVTLVGEQVQNDGLISAKLGAVNLVAGKAAVLTFDPTGMVGVKVTEAVVQDELGVDAAVINNGSINAEGGRVLLSASVSEDVFSDAVNNTGMNKSTSVVVHDDGSFTLGAGADVINTGDISTSVSQGNAGQVVLLGDNVTHSGSIIANTSSGAGGSVELHSTDTTLLTENSRISAQANTQGEGGDIKVLGNKVGLFDQAEVNASGANGGGQVLIGGDKTGHNKQIRNADFIYLGESTKVKTDALINGNGGKLITFASDTARIYGNLYSRGGSERGNGGFIETSGLKGFEILNTPDITASAGTGGTWLIDPYNLSIENTSSDQIQGSGSLANAFRPSAVDAILNVDRLADALVNGSTVYVQTTANGGSAGEGTITLKSELRYNNDPNGSANNRTAISRLIFEAADDIVISSNIVRDGGGSGNLSLELKANFGANKSGDGSVKMISGTRIETRGGSFTATGVNFDSFSRDGVDDEGNGNQNFATIDTSSNAGGGEIIIDVSGYADVGSLIFKDLNSGTPQSQVAKISIKAGGDVSLNKEIDFAGVGSIANDSASFKIESNGNIAINQSILDSSENGLGILNFTLIGHKNGDGTKGNITIANGKTIETRGGYFYAGVRAAADADGLLDSDIATPELSAFTSTGATIDTSGQFGGGDIAVNANGNIGLGVLKFGATNVAAQTRVSNIFIKTGGNVTLNNEIDFVNVGSLANESASFKIESSGNIAINENILDSGDGPGILNFTLIGHKNNDGTKGNITIASGKTVETRGGYFYAGVRAAADADGLLDSDIATPELSGFTSTGATIDTTGKLGGGDIVVNANGDVGLGVLKFGVAPDEANNNALVRVGSVTVLSRADVTFNGLINFNDSGRRQPDGDDGYTNNSLDGQETFLKVEAFGDVSIKEKILDQDWGDSRDALNIDLTAGKNNTEGTINIDADIYTSGGNFTATSFDFDSTGFLINTDKANERTTPGNFGENGDARWSNGGNVSINARNTIKLGSITTDGSCDDPASDACKGNLSISGIDINSALEGMQSSVVVTQLGVLNVAGDTTFNTGTGTITLENIANSFTKDLIFTSAGTTSITDSSLIRLGTSSITGNLKLTTGGNISQIGVVKVSGTTEFNAISTVNNYEIDLGLGNDFGGLVKATKASSLKLKDINDLSLDAITLVTGAAAPGGNIDVTVGATNKIILNGNLDSSATTTKNIILNGNVEIASNTTVNAGTGATAGTISFTGTTNSDDATAKNLTLTGGTITFTGNVGNLSNQKLGDFKITSTGVVSFANITAKSFDVSTTNSFTAQNINTSGADSTLAAGVAGGDIVIEAGSISLTSVNASGGKSTAPGDNAGGNAGDITLTANNTTGSKTITIDDGVSAKGGAGSGAGASGVAGIVKLILEDDTIAGQVNLNSNSFLSSSLTITGSAHSGDTLKLTNSNNDWLITAANSGEVRDADNSLSSPLVSFSGFENIAGGSDADNFVIDSAGSVVSLSGGTGTGVNTLTGRDVNNIWEIDGSNQGDVKEGAITYAQFTNIQNLVGGSLNDAFEFSDPDNSAITGSIKGGIAEGANIINSLKGRNAASTWVITDLDKGNITGYLTSFENIQNLTGGSAADIFNFSAADAAISGKVDGGSTAEGNAITARTGVKNTWTMTGNGAGELAQTNGTTPGIYIKEFSDIQIFTGAGTDTMSYAGINTGTVVVTLGAAGVIGVNNFVGSDLVDSTLIGENKVNAWLIDDANSGSIDKGLSSEITFSDFNNLTGGNLADTFDFSTNALGDISGNIDGGSAGEGNAIKARTGTGVKNTWAMSANGAGSLAQTDSGTSDTYINQFTDIQIFTGAGTDTMSYATVSTGTVEVTLGAAGVIGVTDFVGSALVNSTLIGENKNNDWAIEGVNSGKINAGTASEVTFSDFNYLTGSDQTDTFIFFDAGSITGGSGGIGNDIVDLSNLTTAQTITFTGTTVKGISSIHRVIGSTSQSHTLQATSGTNTWRIFDVDNDAASTTISDGINDGHINDGTNTLQFVNFNNLQGGTDVDTFDIETNFTGAIKGGDNNDIFNIKAAASNIQGELGDDQFVFFDNGSVTTAAGGLGNDIVDLRNLTSDQIINFAGATVKGVSSVSRVIGSTSRNHTLQATSGANTWRIFDFDNDPASSITSNGVNDGHVINGGVTLQFVNFSNLQGGTGVDTFEIETNFSGAIKGGAGNDIFNIKALAGNLDGEIGDDRFVFFDNGSIGTAAGGDGDDIVDLSNLTSAQAITFSGTTVKGVSSVYRVIGNASQNHTLQATAGTNTWRIFDVDNDALSTTVSDGVNDGHINDGTNTLQFVNFSNLQGGSGVDTFDIETDFTGSIKGGNNNDIFNIKAVAGSIDGEAGDDQFVFFDAGSITAAAAGGTGNDIVDLSNLTTPQTITFIGTTVKGVSSVFRVIGNALQNHTLQATAGTNTWRIFDVDNDALSTTVSDGVNDGHITNSNGTLQFVNFSNLQGGSDVDTFDIETNFTGSIKGGGNNDIFNIKAVATNIDGGIGDDRFVFFDSGSIVTAAGDDGDDIVDISNLTSAQTIAFSGTTVKGVTSVYRVIGNASQNHTLQAISGTNSWRLFDIDNNSGSSVVSDGINDGHINNGTDTLQFVNFSNLQGGTGVDTFEIETNFTGSIKGGGNNDIFNIKAVVGNIDGEAGDDSFVFYNTGSITTTGAGGDGNDIVDLSNLTSAQTITFNGTTVKGVSSIYRVIGNASQNHTLQTSSGTNTWRLFDIDNDATSSVVSDGVNDGLINNGTDTLQFVNFSNLQGGSGIDTFDIETNFTGSIKGGDDNDIFNIKAVAGNIQGEAGDDQFVFFDTGSITTAAGGLGKNIVDLSNLTSAQTITFTGTTVKDVSNVYRVIGNASKNHTLQATSGANTWRIFDVDNDALSTTISDGVNDGHITNSIGTMQFVNFGNLQGGGGVDTFEIETNFTGSIKGGGDNDIFNIRAVAGNIDGEAGADQFVFFDNGSVTTATGGADNDVVDLSQLTSQQTIILNGTKVKGVDSVFRIIGSSTLNHTLQATSGTNSWAIYDFDGAGNLADGINDGTVAGIEFVGFSTLRGGSDEDTFTIGQSGSINTIDGGLGTNILIGRNSSNIWNVTGENNGTLTTASGSTYVSTFNRIQNLTGGSGDDQFVFNSLDNAGSIAVIVGGNGANEIIGRNSTNTWSISATDSGSVSVTAGPAYIASFSEIQTLVGGNLADVFDINANVTNSIRAGNGNNIFNINTAVGNLQGGDDNDQFVFGLNGRANAVNGGNGTNSLNARNANNIWTIISSNAGNVANANNDFYVGNFSNIQLLNGGNAADVFNINASAANIYGNDGNDAFVFNLTNNGNANFIDGGSGTNSLRGRNQDTTWTLSGANDGSVSTNANTYVTSFTRIGNLLGGSATDTLAAVNQSNTWIINNSNEGELYLTATPAPTDKILFAGIENLLGNQGIDLFTFTANGSITGLIDGGTSATKNTIKDSLNLAAITGNLTVRLGSAPTAANVINVVNVEDITASTTNQDNHVLMGASDVAYRWKITAQNQGTIERAVDPLLETSVNFVNFGDLRGGTNSDRFDVQGTVTKSIDGGSGIDLVDYSQRKENFVIVLGGSGGLGNTGINGIEGVVGNSASGNGFTSTIQVNSGNNTWEIGATENFGDGINDGSITINQNKVSFENFTNLIGGSDADTFRYIDNGQWIGNIDGGGGRNIINASVSTKDQQFVVNGTGLNSGTNLKNINQLIANTNTNSSLISTLQSNVWQIDDQGDGRLNNNLEFTAISNLQGGSFVDVFSFAKISSLKGTVDGGGGNDTVNLVAMDRAIQVAVDAQTDADINLLNIETINANNNFSNTLKGDLNGNEWHINASNAGVLNKKINFTGFANLTGSALADLVVFDNSAATLTGHLDLGDGQDTLDLSASDRDITVRFNSSKTALASGVLSVDKIEVIKGDAGQSNHLIADNFTNTWTLDDVNAGRVSAVETGTVTFTQFKNISGGNQDDLFVFEALGRLTGLVDGGGEAVRDNVDLSKSNNANVIITTTGESVGFTNVEKYLGNNIDSTLTAANTNNKWSLTGTNRGILNESIEFENFGVLKGGNKQDEFTIDNATISGSIDSGDGDDTFDIRASAIAGKIIAGAGDDRFTFNIASGAQGTANIDGGEGANRLTVEGGDVDYKISHQLGRHEYVSATGNTYSILYSNVLNVFDNVLANSLSIFGTTTADTFRLLTGRYNINNLSTVNYTNKSNLVVNGTADDQVIVDGTVGVESTVTFNNLRVLAENAGKIQAQSLALVNTGSVGTAATRLNTAVNELSLSATNGAVYLDEQDALVFKNFNVSTTELVDIKAGSDLTSAGALTYSGKLNLESERGSIDLGKNNAFAGTVSLKAASNITLDNLQALSLGDLTAQNATLGSSTSINGVGAFSVTGLTTLNAGSEISLMHAGNDINQVAVINANKLDLFDSNGFTTIGLNVTNDVNLRSAGGIVLSTACTVDCSYGINTKNLRVRSDAGVTVAKSIAAVDTINIESQGLVINDSITSKQFILNALNGKLVLNDSGNLLGQEGTGIELTANSIEQRSKITSGGNLKVNTTGDFTMADAAVMESVNGDIALNGNNLQLATLNATKGSTTVNAQGIVVNKAITSKQISLNAGNGKIILNTDGNLLGQEGTGIELTANNIEQRSKIISGGNLKVAATGDVIMLDSALMESVNGNITLNGNNLQLGTLKSANGVTTTTALAAIKDGNGNATNIIATRWQVDALTGIGSGVGEGSGSDAIETEIGVLSALNAGKFQNVNTSTINIANTGVLKIEQLRNNGDIGISNSGDIVLDNTNNEKYTATSTDARAQGGVINANTGSGGGQLLLNIAGGMVRAENKADKQNPDIIADIATFNFKSSYDFGERNRKIIMHIPEVYNQNARLSFVAWHLAKPKVMNDLSKVPSDSLISGRDQLIQIEGLSEIDPAIFTNLRNYVHDEVAILLPVDQRFDDSEDFQ